MSSSYHVTERKCDEPQGAEQRTFSDTLRNWGCDWLEIDLFFDHVFAQTTSCRQCGHTLCTACVTAGYHDMSHWSLLFLLLVCSCHAVGPARHCWCACCILHEVLMSQDTWPAVMWALVKNNFISTAGSRQVTGRTVPAVPEHTVLYWKYSNEFPVVWYLYRKATWVNIL